MNKKESLINDMTSGSVLKLIIAFSAPLFFSNALQAVYNMADMIIVGRVLGENGLSAVSVGGDLLSCLQFVAIGISSAGAVQIAQLVGLGDRERLSRLIGTIFSSLALCALVMTTTCLLLQNHILSWLNTPPEAREFAADYATACTLGLIFIYGYNAISAILRGMGVSCLLGVSLGMGYVGFWYGNAFAGFVPVVLGTIYYKSGRWKTRTIMKK